MLLRPGEKAKIHWHLESVTSAVTNQSIALDLTVITGARTDTITQTLVRESDRPSTSTGTAIATT
ncbi:MAG TPA: hypothetical protein QGI03_04495, partial [Dehalococcoidia bacterium]|nr:hypothetical protein [Dehalococcoidia bacterium]